MGLVAPDVQNLIAQKIKYWTKTLSDDAIFTNMGATYDVFDHLSFTSDIVISDTVFSSLVSSILLDINLTDIVPLNLNWTVELPSFEEFTKGILIKLEPITIDLLVPDLVSALTDVSLFFTPEYAQNFKGIAVEKGIYGKSRYGQAYYDPIAVREFFRSTLYAFLKKDVDYRTARDQVKTTAEVLDVSEDLARNLFNRLSASTSVKEQALTWDYGWWDYSLWGFEGSEGRIAFVSYDLEVVERPYEDMIDLQAGGVWDDALWDDFYWTGDIQEPTHPYRTDQYVISQLAERVAFNFRNRISSTALAVGNYQRAEERLYFNKSERIETFALPVSQRHSLEVITDNLVMSKEPDADAVKIRMYKSAVLELYGLSGSPHRWGAEAQRTMAEDEFREWWVNKWSSLGLSKETLELLYDNVKPTIDTYASVRTRERIYFIRKRLTRVK